jgi:hypothetical protein
LRTDEDAEAFLPVRLKDGVNAKREAERTTIQPTDLLTNRT